MVVVYSTIFFVTGFLCLVVTLKRPADVLLTLIFLTIVWPDYIVYKAEVLPGITPPRGIMLLLLAALFIILTCDKIYRIKISTIFHEFKTIILISFIYVAVQLLSSILNSNQPLPAIFATINRFLMGPLLMILIVFLLDDNNKQKKLYSTLIIAFLIVNIVGLVEWLNRGPLFAKLLITETKYTIIQEVLRGGAYRLMSVFENSLIFSQILLISLPLCIYAFLNSKPLMKKILLINLGLIIFLLIKTGSRAAIALVLTFPFLYLYSRIYFRNQSNIIKYVLICVPLLVFLAGISYTMANHHEFLKLSTIESDADSAMSTQERFRQLEIGGSALLEHPLLGYGVGGGVALMYPRTSIDNLYLTIALDTGITGLFFFLLFNYLLFKYSFKNKGIGNREKYIFITIVLILLFFLILSIDTMLTLYYILIAMILHSTKNIKSGRYEQSTKQHV